MKHNCIISLFILFLCLTNVKAQEVPSQQKWRKNYANVGYIFDYVNAPDVQMSSKYGLSIGIGKTYFVGCERATGNLRWGLDAIWSDAALVWYRNLFRKLDISMGIGPSLTYLPRDDMQIHGYLHYLPSCSWMYHDNNSMIGPDDTWIGFNSIVAFGASCSWKFIGLGLEPRFCFCPYVQFPPCDCEPVHESGFTSSIGLRAFVTFRF